MNEITHVMADKIEELFIENNKKPTEISLRKIFNEVGFMKNKNARIDVCQELAVILSDRLIRFKDGRKSYTRTITNIIDEIKQEIDYYNLPVTIEFINNKIRDIIYRTTHLSHFYIGNLFENFESNYQNQYYIYNLSYNVRIKISWTILNEKQDKCQTVIKASYELIYI